MEMSNEDKEVFDKLDKEFELNQRIQNSFEELHLLKQWWRLHGYLKHHIELIKSEMKSIAPDGNGAPAADSIVMFYDRINFHVFNFLNTAYAFRQSLFLPKEPAYNWKSKEQFDAKATEFKNTYSHRVVNEIRSRVKSGVQLDSTLNYQVRTIHHPKGDGFEIGFDLEASDWDKVKSKLDVTSKVTFENTKSDNYLLEVFELFVSDSQKALKEIEDIFNAVFSKELITIADLKNELDEIECYFDEKGYHRL